MKPSTQERIERIVSRAQPYLSPGQTAALREIVEHELRCVDRDTRHACAEAVLGAVGTHPIFGKPEYIKVILESAHAACMNAQAI